MPRLRQEISPIDPYHIYARANNREHFALPIEDVWDIMSRYLYFVGHAYNFEIHSFVLMPNHFHLISRFPEANLSAAMNYFMRETSREMNRFSNRINHSYGTGARYSRLQSYDYYAHAYKYIYRNPVKAKICEKVEEYKYSTLHGLLGLKHLSIPVAEDTLLFDGDVTENLKWLNTNSQPGHDEAVKKALKKAVFKLAEDPHSRNPHDLEFQRL